ncbi:MAG TPA: hypothetical protein VFG72_03105 [Marmoricola sp.]|nr:hypothetical protein [Marmoricola sp.]
MTRRRAGWPAAALLVIALASGCSTSPGVTDYRKQASLTLGTAVSEVATVRLVLSELADGDTFRPAALTQLRYSEETLGSAAQSFGSLNPPAPADPVHQKTSTLLGNAEELLATVRIAVHRRHTDAYPGLVDDLKKVGSRLEELERRVQP